MITHLAQSTSKGRESERGWENRHTVKWEHGSMSVREEVWEHGNKETWERGSIDAREIQRRPERQAA